VTPRNRSERIIGGLNVHIYDAVSKSATVLIVIPGLHPNGIFDPRFVGFANTCAEAGFQVIAPDIEDYRHFRLSESTFDKALAVMEELPAVLDLRNRRVGVLGISYGSGPAFLIAAKHKIDFVVSIGGYYSLEHAIEFSFSGVHGNAKRPPDEWGRLIFALNHIDDLVDEKDSPAFVEALQLRLQLKEPDEITLSSQAEELLSGILKGLSPQQVDRFRTVARKREKEVRALSPELLLTKIDRETRLYLIHGVSDDSIPFEESLELRDTAKSAGFRTHCLITTGLTHVDVTSPAHLFEFVKMLQWIRLLLLEC
jgi:dienelactone hydrolase